MMRGQRRHHGRLRHSPASRAAARLARRWPGCCAPRPGRGGRPGARPAGARAWLARGFLLSYDMVFVPDQPFSSALLGLNGGPARAVPSDAAIAVASRVLPADILQKLILLLIFVAACAGAAALLAAGWRTSRGSRAPRLACLVSGIFYAWNPFVAERLLIGQWALLLGYAGLPWVLREVCTGTGQDQAARLLLLMLPAAIGGFAALVVTGSGHRARLAGRGAAVRERGCRRRPRHVLAALALLSLPWLIPSLLVPVHADPMRRGPVRG